MKYLASILFFAGLVIGATVGHTASYNRDELSEKHNFRLDDSSTSRSYRNTQDSGYTDEVIMDEDNATTDTLKYSQNRRSGYDSVRESPELQNFYFRGLDGSEAFDEYLIMVGNLLETKNRYSNARYLSVRRLQGYVCLSFSQLSVICSVFVVSVSVLLLSRKR